ncbi:MAG TPA: hypothetical protein VIV11_05675 [Kofleriaceae bacterium]
MNETNDPVRLQLGGSRDAQDLLRSAHLDVPTRAQLDRLAAKLAPTVSISAATVAVTPWLVGAAAVIGFVAVLLVARDREPAATPPPVPAPIVARVEPAPIPAEPSPIKAQTANVETVPPSNAEPEPQPRRSKTAKVAKRETTPPREMDLLGLAHQALGAGDFTRALELATRHRELYEAGVMTEEREAIAIESLFRLGKQDAARARFYAFGAKFPNSGYRARLDHLLADQKR